MKQKLTNFLFTAIAAGMILAGSLSALAQTGGPEAMVRSFYAAERRAPQTFDRKNLALRKRWFSAELSRLFATELTRQTEYLKQNPTDKPHFGDGFPFLPVDSSCVSNGRTYRYSLVVGQATAKSGIASVDVTFAFPKVCRVPDTVFTVLLERSGGKWLIDDVAFPGGEWLSADLKRPVY